MSKSFSGRSLFFEVMRCHNSCRWSRKCFAMLYNFHIHYLWHHCRYHHRHSRESWRELRIHPYQHLKSMMFQFRRCTYMRLNIISLFEIILVIITTIINIKEEKVNLALQITCCCSNANYGQKDAEHKNLHFEQFFGAFYYGIFNPG